MSDSKPNLRALKTRAQTLKPTIRLGKAGATPELLAALNDALEHSPMVKLRFEACKEGRKSLAQELAAQTGSQLISQVGHTAVFHRERKQEIRRDSEPV